MSKHDQSAAQASVSAQHKPDQDARTRQVLERLQAKYEQQGQDLTAYLEGLLYAKPISYWDYINLHALLSLQQPRTDEPDEPVFIMYHQITELYLKLVQHEVDQLIAQGPPRDTAEWLLRINRVAAYFKHLAHSFDVMVMGMEPRQFMRFRLTLTPASGFQSVQIREIELKCTNLHQLLDVDKRPQLQQESRPERLFPALYWKQGGRNQETGEKILTLKLFEAQYDDQLLRLARQRQHDNLHALWRRAPSPVREDPELQAELRNMDRWVNAYWRFSHYSAAAHYLRSRHGVTPATGGTNWAHYLLPRNQCIQYFPEVWSAEERAQWGQKEMYEAFQEEVVSHWR